MKHRVLAGLSLVVMAATNSFGQTITIDQYLDQVKRTHPFFTAEALRVEIETWGRDRFRGKEDWQFGANTALAYQQPVQSNTFTPKSVVAYSLGADAERVFWGSGSRLAFSWSTTVSDQDLPGITLPGPDPIEITIGPSEFYEHRLFASYIYPLLQNRGGRLDRVDYDLAKFNVDAAVVESIENQENFLLSAGLRFIDWALLVEQIRILERRRDYEQEQFDRTTRRRQANLVDEVDVLRGRNAVVASGENLVFAESAFKAKQAELAVIAQDRGIYELTPALDIYELQNLPEIDAAVARLDDHRIIQLIRVRANQLRQQQAALEEVKKPQLSLSLNAGLQKGDKSFFDSWTLDDPQLSAGLDFNYPIGNRAATADATRGAFEIRQLEEELKSAKLDLEAQLRAILIAIRELEKVLALNEQSLDIALELTLAEQRLYEQGRNELQFVIQSRDAAAIAALTYALNAADYQKLVLQYQALMNEILPGP